MLYNWDEGTFWKETFDEVSKKAHTEYQAMLINVFFLPKRELFRKLREEGGGANIPVASQKLFEKFLDDKQSMGDDICQAAEEIGQAFIEVKNRALYEKMQRLVKVRFENCNRCISAQAAHSAFPSPNHGPCSGC